MFRIQVRVLSLKSDGDSPVEWIIKVASKVIAVLEVKLVRETEFDSVPVEAEIILLVSMAVNSRLVPELFANI